MGDKPQIQDVSRRRFLSNASKLAVGAVAGIGALSLAGCSSAAAPAATPTAKPAPAATPVANTKPAVDLTALPWKYEKIDVDKVRKLGYENYFKGGCAFAASSALVTVLKETVGAPWDQLPVDMFKWGAGGALGWGTLCGALNGALGIMQLAAGKDMNPMGNELMGWYTQFPFPSAAHDSYAKFPKQITTVSQSPLCHQSVSTWVNEADAKINGDEKKDRCAKLAGDTAAKAAELLNAWKAGGFAPAFKADAEYASCMTCHTGKDSMLDNEQGLMSCVTCHDDKTTKHP